MVSFNEILEARKEYVVHLAENDRLIAALGPQTLSSITDDSVLTLHLEELHRLDRKVQVLLGAHAMQCLNTDVLIHTFSWLSVHGKPADLSFLSNNIAPLNVSQVCRAWRYAALSCPRLWASFALLIRRCVLNSAGTSLRGKDGMVVCLDTVLTAWKLWLSRSASAPLTIKMFLPKCSDSRWDRENYSHIGELLETMLLHTRRWKNISIKTSFNERCAFVFSRQEMPLLENLSLLVEPPSGTNRAMAVHVNLAHIPRLSYLCLRCLTHFVPTETSLSNLRFLEVSVQRDSPQYSAWNAVASVMRHASHLEVLEITIPCVAAIGGVEPPDVPEIRLPCLRNARVRLLGYDSDTQNYVLSRFTLPAVTALDIEIIDLDFIEPVMAVGAWTGLADLLRRSRPPLRKLTLKLAPEARPAGPADPLLVSILFAAAPFLEELVFVNMAVADDLAIWLKSEAQMNDGTQKVFPHLKKVDFGS